MSINISFVSQIIGPNSVMLLRRMLSNIKSHQQFLLRFIAINEIILMPTLIVMCFQSVD